MNKSFCGLLMFIISTSCVSAQSNHVVNMKDVQLLAKRSVDEIFIDTQIESFDIENYWNKVHGRGKPLIVFFYSNVDGPSQRLATLIKYVAPDYNNKVSFGKVKVTETGKPDELLRKQLTSNFSLDKTPGILFYDNVGEEMRLEDEDYIEADFKEFRTPSLFLWKTYYSGVRKELDNLLSD